MTCLTNFMYFFIVSFNTSSRCSRSSYLRRRRTVWCVEMMNIPLMSIFMYFRKKIEKSIFIGTSIFYEFFFPFLIYAAATLCAQAQASALHQGCIFPLFCWWLVGLGWTRSVRDRIGLWRWMYAFCLLIMTSNHLSICSIPASLWSFDQNFIM